MSYLDIFSKNHSLIEKLGNEKAHTAWVMGRYIDEPDLDALAANALTDGPDDKKIDFIYLDHDGKRLIFAQGFFSAKHRESAPANKASDLNTAAAWLFSGDIEAVPENIRDTMRECREALANDEIETIDLFYIHNLGESVNVARELQTVEEHIRKTLDNAAISVRANELGATRIQHLQDSQESHIEVKDRIAFPEKFHFRETGPNWTAYVTSVPGIWLHSMYTKYGDSLFSANYRGFLGGGRRRRVNAGIRESAEGNGPDFWAFNNGITILTLNVVNSSSPEPHLTGMSIINGAQTTGSIGSIDITKNNLASLRVLCRVIEVTDADKIDQIVRFNNTQNVIRSWDQYSNDPEQKRLAQEFLEIGVNYTIKRGILASGEQLGIDEVIQPLLAFHGKPQDAVRGRNTIFERKQLYQDAFDGKKARHVLLVFALSKAIDQKRLDLKAKASGQELIEVEERQLALMRNLRFKPFLLNIVAKTLETALGKRCDPHMVAFDQQTASSHSLVELTAIWTPVVDTLLSLVAYRDVIDDFAARLADEAYTKRVADEIKGLLHAMGSAEKHQPFAQRISGT